MLFFDFSFHLFITQIFKFLHEFFNSHLTKLFPSFLETGIVSVIMVRKTALYFLPIDEKNNLIDSLISGCV